MNSRRFSLFVLAFLCALFSGSRIVQAAPTEIRGIALNATKMQPASGLKLELLRPNVEQGAGTLVGETTTGADGRFSFGKPEVGKEDLLLIRAAYSGYGFLTAAYDGQGRLKDFGVAPKPASLQVQIYEASKKPPKLTFQVHHLAIESSAKGIKVIERIVVENPSNTVYTGVGNVKGTVLLDVPAGARDVKMDPKIPGKLEKTSHGWMATTPVAPSSYTNRNPLAGPNAIIFEYFLDWPSNLPWARKVSLSQKILYPTNFLFIARKTEDQVLQIVAPKLSKDEQQELPIDGNTEVRLVNSIGRPMGDNPALKVDDQVDMQVTREVNPLFWAFLAFLGAIALLVPLALRSSHRRRDSRNEEVDDDESELQTIGLSRGEPSQKASVVSGTSRPVAKNRATSNGARPASAASELPSLLPPNVQNLIEEIAQLDDEWERGEVVESEYRQRRIACKNQIADALSQS